MRKLLTADDLGVVRTLNAFRHRRAATVAGCPTPSNPPSWPSGRGGGGSCDGNWIQCEGMLPAVTTAAGGGSGTLTFDVSAAYFREFVPTRLVLVAVDAAAVETDLIRGLRITSISYAGIEIALGTSGIPAILFDPNADGSIRSLRLPTLMVGGQDLVLTIGNVDTTTTATITGTLIGDAWRQAV